jgi:ABC-type dipeptide/oligopeptide/nickel transport system permease component
MLRKSGARLFILIIMSCVILLTGFFLLRLLPGNNARLQTAGFNDGRLKHSQTGQYLRQYYAQGMHLPLFYFSIGNLAVPDSFNNLPDDIFRHALIRLSLETGRPAEVYRLLQMDEKMSWQKQLRPAEISASALAGYYNEAHLKNPWYDLAINRNTLLKFVPAVSFQDNNQFHRWLFGDTYSKGILRGDLGTSSFTGRKVLDELKRPFAVTLQMTLLSLIFSSVIAAILAVWLSNKSLFLRKYVASPLFLLIYSIPVFVIGTFLLYLFANPDVLQWIPASGFEEESASVLPWFLLPVICYSLATIVFISRLLLEGFEEESNMDYTRTALAKGADMKRIRRIHQLRNILISAVVIIIGSFPVLLNGSVLIESIFSVPGLGSLMIRAIQTRDVPLLTGFFMMTGLITILTYQLIDWLAVRLDPRIRIATSNHF